MKKITAFLMAAIMCFGMLSVMAACSKEDTDIAFITSMDTTDTKSAAASCLEGIAKYSEASGLKYRSFSGTVNTQIKEAKDAGAEVIVLFGVDDESAVYSYAGKYKDTKFICIDFGNDFLVRPNIQCVNMLRSYGGVYAGYSAVKEGNLTVGIQGEENEETYNYIMGFLEGAQIAAMEIGVSRKPINIYYNVSGSDMAVKRSQSWFDNGCSVIFCSDSTYKEITESIKAPELNKVMTYGADRVDEDDRIIASVYGKYNDLLFDMLSSAYNGEFKGGVMSYAGAYDGLSGFSYDKNKFNILTDSDLTELTSFIIESDISDKIGYRVPSDKGYSKIKLIKTGIISDSE